MKLTENLTTPAWAASTWPWIVLLAQTSIALVIGLPGQLSVDSIVELYEGRTGRFIDIHPPLTSILLGALDRIADGPIGFVLISTGLLAGATYLALRTETRTVRLWQLVLGGLLVLNPVLLIYSGIVWKDVLFAHAIAALYFLLSSINANKRPITVLVGTVIFALLFTVAGARQQGALFAIPAGVWAAILLRRSKTLMALGLVIFAALPVVATRVLEAYVRSFPNEPALSSVGTGFRILARFDLAGILHYGGTLPKDTDSELANELRAQSSNYSKYRVDTLTGPQSLYWALGPTAERRLWLRTIGSNLGPYLHHRGSFFLTLLGLADMHECLPVYSGVAGPVVHSAVGKDLDAILGLTPGPRHWSRLVNGFGTRFANTPLFMHIFSAVMLIVLCSWLIRRREYILLTFSACSLLLLSSYFFVGIACDFRYAYTLTVATTLLLAYLAVRPARDGGTRDGTPITA